MKIIGFYTFQNSDTRFYLWSHGNYKYSLGTISYTVSNFDGFTLPEVQEKITKYGYTKLDVLGYAAATTV